MYKEEIFHYEGGETLEWFAQRRSGGPIPRNFQRQVGWGSEQPGMIEDVPTLRLHDPFQPKAFHGSMIP